MPWIGRHPVHVAPTRASAVLVGGLARVAVMAKGLQVGRVIGAAVLKPRDVIDFDGFGYKTLTHTLGTEGVQA
jgi:hypothetical protein